MELSVGFDFQNLLLFLNQILQPQLLLLKPLQIVRNQVKVLTAVALEDHHSIVIGLLGESPALLGIADVAGVVDGVVSVVVERNSFQGLVQLIGPGARILNESDFFELVKRVSREFLGGKEALGPEPELIF